MSDLDIITNLSNEPIRPPEYRSLDSILAEYPLLNTNSPTLFHLYLTYNDKCLSDAEKTSVEKVIEKLRMEQTFINRKNVEYMERHKVMNIDTINGEREPINKQ